MRISPLQVGAAFWELCAVGLPPGYLLPMHTLYSLSKVLAGVLLAVLLGCPLGLALGASRGIQMALMPLIDFIRPIPPLAWILLAIIWFGIGFGSAVFLIFLGAFFPIVLGTCSGVRGVDPLLVDAVRTLGGNRRDIWLKVLLPGAMPSLLTGIKVGTGIGWMTLVAAEFTGVRQGYGLGYMIMSARDLQRLDAVVAGMVGIGMVGLALEWMLGRIYRWLLRWQ
ncbi:MAG: ABC transporter permease [Desulfovibrio sp.]|jgi:ABC-type nitrate/sulfonate/bicarbonate transport system permease component|nr:ABC transporter permease [Desulfovibrio sp.]